MEENKKDFTNAYVDYNSTDIEATNEHLKNLTGGHGRVAIVNPGPYGGSLLYKSLLSLVKQDPETKANIEIGGSIEEGGTYEYHDEVKNLLVVQSQKLDAKGNVLKTYEPVGGLGDEVMGSLDGRHLNKAKALTQHTNEKGEPVENDLAYAIANSDFVLITDNSSKVEETLDKAIDTRKTLNRPNVVLGVIAKGTKSLELAEKYPDIVFLDGFHNAGKLTRPLPQYLTDVNCRDAATAFTTAEILKETMPGFAYKPSVETFANMHRCAAKNLNSLLCGFAEVYYDNDFAAAVRNAAIDQINDQASIIANKFKEENPTQWNGVKPKAFGNNYSSINATLKVNGDTEQRDLSFKQDLATNLDVERSMSYPSDGKSTRNMRAGMIMGFYALIHKEIPTVDQLMNFCQVAASIGNVTGNMEKGDPTRKPVSLLLGDPESSLDDGSKTDLKNDLNYRLDNYWNQKIEALETDTADKLQKLADGPPKENTQEARDSIEQEAAEAKVALERNIEPAKELLVTISALRDKEAIEGGISDLQIEKFLNASKGTALTKKALEGVKSLETMPAFLEKYGVEPKDRTFVTLLTEAMKEGIGGKTHSTIMMDSKAMLDYIMQADQKMSKAGRIESALNGIVDFVRSNVNQQPSTSVSGVIPSNAKQAPYQGDMISF